MAACAAQHLGLSVPARADMQHCPNCGGGELKIIAAILEWPVIEKILAHWGWIRSHHPRGLARENQQPGPHCAA